MNTLKNIVVVCVLLLGGCAHEAKPISAPAINIAASYSEKLPGRYAVYIEADEMLTAVSPQDINCAAHNFPLDFRNSLKVSIARTLANAVETGEVVETPLSRDQLTAHGYNGLIVVRAHDLQPQLKFVPGYYQASAQAQVEFLLTTTVDGPSGRLFGKTIEGTGREQTSAGAFCAGGSKAISAATRKSMKRAMTFLGESIANSERLRKAQQSI